MGFQVSNIYPGQAVPDTTAAKLVFTALNALINGLFVVPAGCVILLTSLMVTNTTSSTATLQIWKGTAASAAFTLIGKPINISPATVASPSFQVLTAPIILMPGDSIWGLSGTAAALSITGDGEVIVQ